VSVTAAATTAPDGTLTGQKIAENTTTSGAHQVVQSITFTAAAWTFSVYVKPAERTWVFLQQDTVPSGSYFNLSGAGSLGSTTGTAPTARSITAVGNGWYRLSMTFTATAVGAGLYIMPATADLTNSYVGTVNSGIYAWGAQAEVGAFPGPYVATTSASATRGAASASVGGLSLPAPATVYVEFNLGQLGAGGADEVLFGGVAGMPSLAISSSGTLTSSARTLTGLGSTANTYTPGGLGKAAFRYQSGSSALCLNGGAVASNASTFTPAASGNVGIGYDAQAGGSAANGIIRLVVLYPSALTNAQLQQLTT
jgi:hypothetical protein